MILNDHRQWLYHRDGEGRIFEEGEPITEGWYDNPNPEIGEAMWGDHVDDDVPEQPEPPLRCDECDLTYKDPRWYARHMLKEHDIVVEV